MLTNDEVVFNPTVVEPGSPDDPFSANYKGDSASAAASPAASVSGVPPVTAADGPQVPTGTSAATPSTPSPAPATPAATPDAPQRTLEELLKDPTLVEHFAGLMNEKVGTALRTQQSSYDKQISALKTEVKEAREANLRIERETKLEGLNDDERDILKKSWELEDKARSLEEYESTLDEYWQGMYVANLVAENRKFGVTAEDFDGLTEPEQMDIVVLRKEAEFYRNGGAQTPAPTAAATSPAAAPAASVPAGASAPTDVGGSSPSAPPPKLDDGVGMDVMARNLNMMKWESLPLPA